MPANTGTVPPKFTSADGSIVSDGVGGIKVGALQTDAQHGALGGGDAHAVAVSATAGVGGTAGFLTAVDKERILSLFSTVTDLPVVIDRTGYTTSAPVTVKNGKSASGVVAQVTGTAATGFLLNDSTPTLKGSLGYAVSGNDWVTGSSAGTVVLTSTVNMLIKPSASNKVDVVSGLASASIDDNVGVSLTYSGFYARVTSANFKVVTSGGDDCIQVKNDGSVILAGTFADLAVGATAGFLQIREIAGTPTGAASDGSFASDPAGSKLWIRQAGAWRSVAVA